MEITSSLVDPTGHAGPPVTDAVTTEVQDWFAEERDHGMLHALLGWLAEAGNTPPICVDAVAGYVHAVTCVEQEIIHPDGRIESHAPPQSGLSQADLAHPRFAFIVASWFDDLTRKLPGMRGEWDTWQSRGFRCVSHDDATGETICWIVREVARMQRSTWSVRVESATADSHHLTFAVPHSRSAAAVSHRPVDPGPHGTLARAYVSFRRRLGRVLALLQHLERLDVESTEEYRQWCVAHQFSPGLVKSVRKRRAELDASAGEMGSSDHDAWFLQVVGRLHGHSTRPGDLRTAYLRLLDRAFAGGLAGGARDAFRDLLLHCKTHTHLGGTRPAFAQLGQLAGNSYVEALAELARRYRHWLRPLLDWRPSVEDPRGQFASLARHLLARYDPPLFMDTAWFCGRSRTAQRHQAWFLHLADGGSIRAAGFPLKLTKRMAHCFTEAPAGHTIESALRRAQVVGQGGSDELADAILATPLGESFDSEAFWSSVVTWWVKHPELDPELVAPIYDFIQYRKFEPREVAQPGGVVRLEPPPEPNFSMKSRSVPKLLEAIDAWHVQLLREARAAAGRGWPKSSIPDFQYEEGNRNTNNVRRWKVEELLTHHQLASEGREMRHCVASYASQCRSGKLSVWSLQVSDASKKNRHLITIALDPRTHRVAQVRGRLNLTARSIRLGKKGSDDSYAAYVARAHAVLDMWMQANGLRQRDSSWRG